jgi:CRISPR/Cas system-associated exonuclease Cas4 (RecB family)
LISGGQERLEGYGGVKKIPASWLNSYAYCEYQIYLEHGRGVTPQPKAETEESKAAQASLDQAYRVAAKHELSVDDAMAKAGAEGIVVSARGVAVEGADLEGCIDEIVFMPDRILVIDDKPGDMAWPGSRMQAWGYCVAFEEQYSPTLPIMSGIRGQDTGYEVWAQPFAQGHREEVQRAIFRIRQLIDGEAIPVGTRNRRKCKACRLAASCDVKAE